MYLDTDIILALIKEEDWLKRYISLKDIKNPKTSALTIVEAELVLLREYSRKNAIGVLNKIQNLGINILPITAKTLNKSKELLEKYNNLNIFDSVHAACAILCKEKIISTDNIYSDLDELTKIDPREINKK